MAKECFCGCGRKVDRRLKTINKRAAEIGFLAGQLESHTLPVQQAYVLIAERGDDPAEAPQAREAVATTQELLAEIERIRPRLAEAVHDEDPAAVSEQTLAELKENLAAQDANTRKLQFTVGLKYDEIPSLGPEGIAGFVEQADRVGR